MSTPQKPAALRRPAQTPQQQKPSAQARTQPPAAAQAKPNAPQRPAPNAAHATAQAIKPRALPQRNAPAPVQPKAAVAAPARPAAAAQRPTPTAPQPYRPNVNVLQRMRQVTRLTATDAEELAPTITSTDNGKVIGPFDGGRVSCGKTVAFSDFKERYAIAPDLDSHSGAFTWKLFKKSGKGWQRIDTLNSDGTRQNRG